jgi:hypothetical protein
MRPRGSLCRAEPHVSLHLTVLDAPAPVRAWAERRPEVVLGTTAPPGVSGWNVKPSLLLHDLNAGWPEALWLDDDIIVTGPVSALIEEFPPESLIVVEEWRRSTVPLSHFWNLPPARWRRAALRPTFICGRRRAVRAADRPWPRAADGSPGARRCAATRRRRAAESLSVGMCMSDENNRATESKGITRVCGCL